MKKYVLLACLLASATFASAKSAEEDKKVVAVAAEAKKVVAPPTVVRVPCFTIVGDDIYATTGSGATYEEALKNCKLGLGTML